MGLTSHNTGNIIFLCVWLYSVFSSAVSVPVQCTQRWASIGTALKASENDIVKAVELPKQARHVCVCWAVTVTSPVSQQCCHSPRVIAGVINKHT